MDVIGPILVAAVTTAGGILATWLAARRLSSLGLGDAQSQVNRSLRELAATERAKRELLEEQLASERAAHEATRAERDRYRQEADDCDRRVNNLYSELRQRGRLEDRRGTPRPPRQEG